MIGRAALVLLLCVCFLLAPASQAKAGDADEVLLGFVFGTSFGLLFGGAMLIFYTNPESDKNIETVLMVSGIAGAAGGIVFGSLLPDDAAERDPLVSMKKKSGPDDWNVSFKPPKLAVAAFREKRENRCGIFANLFRLEF